MLKKLEGEERGRGEREGRRRGEREGRRRGERERRRRGEGGIILDLEGVGESRGLEKEICRELLSEDILSSLSQ